MKYGSVCSGIEAASMAWEPLGFQPQFFSEIDPFPCAVLGHHWPHIPNHGDMTKFKEWPNATIDILVGGTPCQSFSIAGLRKGLADPRGNLMLTYLAIAARYSPNGWYGKTSPAYCPVTKGEILPPSSTGWQNSGMGSPTAFLTLSTSECHNAAAASSLLQILEAGSVPQRYFLSERACQGILRRAETRKKTLPPLLKAALERT